MELSSKIYIAGHRGLVGSALVRTLQAKAYTKLLTRTHAELDLTNQAASEAFFAQEQPDFVNAAAKELGMQIRWEGKGIEEKGFWIDRHPGGACPGMLESGGRDPGSSPIVAVDPRYFRPTEVETLLGDPAKAKAKLGWTPKITFDELVAEMVREDLKSAERDELIKKHGYKAMDYHE